ncbi:O-antigen ligase family protein [Novosphingobium album (ex Liu et al. 2023)]|uniref:O-antigen ligase family protein n=1 Tax=Novosphingobium album (ex Liu et al. 2023) TaxID=3031130 RepID=A0ABT5WQH8_9SPHN|nr:O-antigen ligase family protein [Novosphingobium album (ex Liu et al. 2023)]MDE8652297.1 O-antigen ligase family protein [Novosphingobium album (ex Liu et al. 2023)]
MTEETPDFEAQASPEITTASGKIRRRVRRQRKGSRSARTLVQPVADKPLIRPLLSELAFVGLLVLALTGPLMTFNETGSEGGFSALRQGGYLMIAALAAFAIRAERNLSRLLVIPWPLVAALAFCLLSVAWAIEPSIALRRVVLTSLVVWTTFALVNALGYDRSLFLVRAMLGVLLTANFLAVYGDPGLGIHPVDIMGDDGLQGDWRGIMAHKNAAGLISVLTIFYYVFDAAKIPIWIRGGVIAGAAFFLFNSASKTSLAVGVVALFLGLLFTRYKHAFRVRVLTILLGMLGMGAILQSVYANQLQWTLNDPGAFTGRTVIWQAMWAYHRDNPLLGSGFGSFWNIGPNSPIYHYGRGWVFNVTQAHNGYLDLLVQIGPIGLALVIFAVAINPLLRLLGSPQTEGQSGALIAATLVFCLGHNLTETTLFDRDSIGQVFLMLTLASLWTLTRSSADTSRDLLAWANRQDVDAPALKRFSLSQRS